MKPKSGALETAKVEADEMLCGMPIDPWAARQLPPSVARRLRSIPVAASPTGFLVATAQISNPLIREALEAHLHRSIELVEAPLEDVLRSLEILEELATEEDLLRIPPESAGPRRELRETTAASSPPHLDALAAGPPVTINEAAPVKVALMMMRFLESCLQNGVTHWNFRETEKGAVLRVRRQERWVSVADFSAATSKEVRRWIDCLSVSEKSAHFVTWSRCSRLAFPFARQVVPLEVHATQYCADTVVSMVLPRLAKPGVDLDALGVDARSAQLMRKHAAGRFDCVTLMGPRRSGRTTLLLTLLHEVVRMNKCVHMLSDGPMVAPQGVTLLQPGGDSNRGGSTILVTTDCDVLATDLTLEQDQSLCGQAAADGEVTVVRTTTFPDVISFIAWNHKRDLEAWSRTTVGAGSQPWMYVGSGRHMRREKLPPLGTASNLERLALLPRLLVACRLIHPVGGGAPQLVCESLEVTPELVSALVAGGTIEDLTTVARSQGFQPLRDQLLDLVARGDLDEEQFGRLEVGPAVDPAANEKPAPPPEGGR